MQKTVFDCPPFGNISTCFFNNYRMFLTEFSFWKKSLKKRNADIFVSFLKCMYLEKAGEPYCFKIETWSCRLSHLPLPCFPRISKLESRKCFNKIFNTYWNVTFCTPELTGAKMHVNGFWHCSFLSAFVHAQNVIFYKLISDCSISYLYTYTIVNNSKKYSSGFWNDGASVK